MEEYVRPTVPTILPGLTEEETGELHNLVVEGAMFGYHSLTANKFLRFRELQARVDDASRSAGEPV